MKSELAFCQTFTILHYYTAAEYNIAVIEHNVLSRSYRSYLFIKHDPDRISALRIYGTRLFGLSVTCLCLAFKLAFGIFKLVVRQSWPQTWLIISYLPGK